MYECISVRLTDFLLKAGVVTADKAEIYAFGFESIISRIGTVFYLLLAAFLLNAVPEAAVYYLVFLLMRKYAGGYHAATYVRCNTLYVCSFTLIVVLNRLIFYFDIANFVVIPLILYALFTVWRLAPIENPNNPIARGKGPAYRRYALLLAGGLAFLTLILMLFAFPIHVMSALTMGLAATYMYAEIIKRRKECSLK